jgi:hypothetical protein
LHIVLSVAVGAAGWVLDFRRRSGLLGFNPSEHPAASGFLFSAIYT